MTIALNRLIVNVVKQIVRLLEEIGTHVQLLPHPTT